ncbi:MAG: 50S ribosomal protein L35 [Candidatus Dependentiae bacterium]|nr:50S ribosomal protein L35 [Candidatus Dependentiae bacterium]
MAHTVKMKKHSGATKRFKKVGSGEIKFSRSGRRHLMTGKTAKTKRQLRRPGHACPGDARRVAAFLA